MKYEEVNTKKGTDTNFITLLSGNPKIDMKAKLTKLVSFLNFLKHTYYRVKKCKTHSSILETGLKVN